MAAVGERAILFVHPSDELYGADRCLLELARGLPVGWRPVVALPRDVTYAGALSRELEAAGVDVRRIDYAVLRRGRLRLVDWPTLSRRLVMGSWRLARLAREVDADIIHTNTLAAVAGPVAAVIARRGHVWQAHEVIADERWGVRLAYRLLLALTPGRVIANSAATAKSLVGPMGLLRRRMAVVYPGIEMAEPAGCQRSGVGLRVGFVGRLAPRKGIGELLEAGALLRAQGVELELRVFGAAPQGQEWREGQYRRRADGLGLGDVVQFEGFDADVRRRLHELDVLVVPSQRPEPFGLVVVEGMMAGCAVVACRNGGGSDEIIEHGVTGLYCGRNAASIAAAVGRLAGDEALRERIGRRAAAVARERFTVERYVTGVLDTYLDVLHRS